MSKLRFLLRPVAGIAVSLCLLLTLELLLRFGAFVWHGFSQYYLFYGFHSLAGRAGVSAWHTSGERYYKFPPNYQVRNAAGQDEEVATINSQGFRGPEFQRTKSPRTSRGTSASISSTTWRSWTGSAG